MATILNRQSLSIDNIPIQEVSLIITRTGRQKLPKQLCRNFKNGKKLSLIQGSPVVAWTVYIMYKRWSILFIINSCHHFIWWIFVLC